MKRKIFRNFGGSSCPQDDAKAIAQGAKIRRQSGIFEALRSRRGDRSTMRIL
jgi:hypothetical protein